MARACNYTKSNTPPWVFFMFFKLYKWYQVAQNITYKKKNIVGAIMFSYTLMVMQKCSFMYEIWRHFKGCLPQILFGPLLNTLPQLKVYF